MPEAEGVRVGRGRAGAHHGEILQGVFRGPDGAWRRGLVTLPCPLFTAEAEFAPGPQALVEPPWNRLALHAAMSALRRVGAPGAGRLRLRSNIPMGWGLGSSTADVVAAIRAAADAYAVVLPAIELARMAIEVEVASDSTMFDERVVLWAQRDAMVLQDLGGPFPELEITGFNTGPGLPTLRTPPASYSDTEAQAFGVLLGLLRRAIEDQDPELVARVATASARISQRHVPKAHFEELVDLAARVGALGIQVAHSGTVVGAIFDPADPALERKRAELRRALGRLRLRPAWTFGVGGAAGSRDAAPMPSAPRPATGAARR